MIHHVSVGTNDIKRARAFYEALMSHIGFRLLKASDKAVHFGSSDIMFSLETPINGLPATPGNGVHIAFQAPDRQTVRQFYEAAIANGATDEGAPGLRDNYNANYYCAFVQIRMETRLRLLPSQRGKHSNDGNHVSKIPRKLEPPIQRNFAEEAHFLVGHKQGKTDDQQDNCISYGIRALEHHGARPV